MSNPLDAFRIQALRYRLAMDPALNADSLAQHHALARLIGEDAGEEVVDLLRRHIAKTADDYQNTLSLGLPTSCADSRPVTRIASRMAAQAPSRAPFVDSAKPRG